MVSAYNGIGLSWYRLIMVPAYNGTSL